MKKTWILFANTLRRSRLVLLVALLCGLALCAMFGLFANMMGSYYGGIPVGLLAHEETAVTRDFRSYLAGELGMEVLESTDGEQLNTALVERHIAAVVEMPKGFEAALLGGDPIPLEVSFLDDYANAAFVQGYLESYTASLSTLALGAGGNAGTLSAMLDELPAEMAPVSIQATTGTTLAAVTQQNAFRQIMGFYLMFCFLLAFATALQLFDDRQNGLYRRVRVSNVRTAQYLAGTCSVGMLNAVVLIAPFFVYLAVTRPAIGMRLWQAAVLCLLYALFVVGVALAASLYLTSKNAITAGIIGASTIMCMLGGAYFPIETSPEYLQRLARATPQFWFIDAIEALQTNASAAWGLNATVIALFALLFFILAGIHFVQGSRKKHTA